jgi:glycine/D-amino acid oxidase-like deaminating enzyme
VNIAIIGTGYVGLVTGVCFAEFGLGVTAIDKDADRIDRLLCRLVRTQPKAGVHGRAAACARIVMRLRQFLGIPWLKSRLGCACAFDRAARILPMRRRSGGA